MPIQTTTRGFKGRAIVNVIPLDGVGRKFALGNTSAITENVEVERTSRQNFQTSGGGELDVDESITSITAELTVDDIKPETIAIGMRADIQKLVSTPQTGEVHRAWSRERISFKYLPDPDVAFTAAINATAAWAGTTGYAQGALVLDTGHAYLCTVAGTSGASEPTWPTNGGTVTDGTVTWKDLGTVALVKDTDYAHTKHGIEFLPGGDRAFSGDIATEIAVGYTANPQYVIEAFLNSGREYAFEIDGENAADGGAPNGVRYFRAKPSPMSGFNRVGTEFGSMTLSLTLLEDSTRIGAGKSKYMQVLMV